MKRREGWKLPGYGLKDVRLHLLDRGERAHPGCGCRAPYPRGGTGRPVAPVRLVLLEKVRARSARVT